MRGKYRSRETGVMFRVDGLTDMGSVYGEIISGRFDGDTFTMPIDNFTHLCVKIDDPTTTDTPGD